MHALIPGSSSRPADVYLPNWKRDQPAALDVTVISTLQSLTLSGAAVTPGYALSVAAERKRAAHASACHSVGVSFTPLVVESLGGWDSEAISTFKAIGRLQGLRLGIPPSQSTRHLFQRVAICLWRGNATLWIGRLPGSRWSTLTLGLFFLIDCFSYFYRIASLMRILLFIVHMYYYMFCTSIL